MISLRDVKTIHELLALEYELRSLLHGHFNPLTNTIARLCGVARVLIEDRDWDGTNVTLHCRLVRDMRGQSYQATFSIPICMLDCPDDEDLLRPYVQGECESAKRMSR